MGTASAGTNLTATERRTLRRLRALLAEQFVPPICAQIRAARERLRQEALARGDREAAREFTQERIAQKIHLTTKAYRAYEEHREPKLHRRQEIARALGLDASYFESAAADSRQQEIALLREELAGTGAKVDRLATQLEEIRRELQQQAQPPAAAKRRRAT